MSGLDSKALTQIVREAVRVELHRAGPQPQFLTEDAAAAYCCYAPRTFRNYRFEDRQLIAAGMDPTGPPWLEIGRAVRYDRAALDAWARSHGVTTTTTAEERHS